MEKLSTQEILDARLDDWRKLAQALHTRYRIKDFQAGAAFVAAIAEWSFALLLIRQAASASVLSRASVIFAGSRA